MSEIRQKEEDNQVTGWAKTEKDKQRLKGKSRPRSQRKKPAKPLPQPTMNIKLKIEEAIQEHRRATGTAPTKIVLPRTGEAELTKLKPADIGDDLAGKVWNEGIGAFKGKFLDLPFEIRDDCEDIRIE